MCSTITTSILEESPARVPLLSPLDDCDTRRRSSPALSHGAFEIPTTKTAAFRATMMVTPSPPPTPRAMRPPRRDSLARRLRSNSGLSLHVNTAALRRYTDYNPDGTPVKSEFAIEWGAIDSIFGSPTDGTPGSRTSVVSMPVMSWRNDADGSASPSSGPDILGMDVMQMVLKNPETSDRLLRFAQSRRSAECMEFLMKLKEYANCVNTVTYSMADISSRYLSIMGTSPLRLPNHTSRALNADVKHVAAAILPALETLFADARAHAEQRIAREQYPAFVRTQLALATSAALATEVRHSARHFDPRFPGLADAFCLADPLQFDCPVVFVSDGMADLVGRGRDEIIGRNCRFLQSRNNASTTGGGTQQQHPIRSSTARLRAAMQEASMAYLAAIPEADRSGGILELVLNYRRDADGILQPFWNLLFVCPLITATGRVAYYLGGQVNISEAISSDKELLDILGSAGGPRPTSSSTGSGSSDGGAVSSPLVAVRTLKTEGSTTAVEGDGSSSGGDDTALPSTKARRYKRLQRKKVSKKNKKNKEDGKADTGCERRGRADAPAASSNGDDEQQEDERTRRRSMTRGFSFKTFRRQQAFERGSPTTATATRDGDSVSPSSPLTLIPWSPPSSSLSINGSPTALTPTLPGGAIRTGTGDDTASATSPPEFLGAYVRHMVLEYAAAATAEGAPPRMRIEFCSPAALKLLGLAALDRVLHQDVLAVLARGRGHGRCGGKITSTRITVRASDCEPETSGGGGGGGGGGGFHFSAARRRSATVAAGKKKPRIPSILTGRSESSQQTAEDPGSSARTGDAFEGMSTWKGLGGGGGSAASSAQQNQQREQDIVCHWTPLRNAEGTVRWVVLILVPVSS
ncbi:hypothetical protein MAPG_06012 [Magnaporthiopsis poae ATCC 64411]|uniref:RGS domain-containing protein n=1 Tax=Magnaporthiopsis poae (strain ATCC 64411 / 73-15) TaxID=644358 RepID=A0A0C4E0X2_MAGP6|nr:hypothetical protein MAPG_06012 [Magnaporthiopsis poae ATCC 64411]